MGFFRTFLDTRVAPLFHPGGKLSALYPLYEALDTFVFAVGDLTRGSVQVRDGVDLKRVMIEVYIAVLPVVIAGCYFTGHAALSALNAGAGHLPSDFHGWVLGLILPSNPSAGFFNSLVYGLVYFLPLYVVVFIVGMAWELLFASVRRHEVNEGFFVTTILFVLSLPAGIPLWQAVLGISFGLVLGKEVFGGAGMNFMNPALVGRVFLYLAYPGGITGEQVWVPLDGYSGATWLAALKSSLPSDYNFHEAWVGSMAGALGETSAWVIGLAAIFLVARRIASVWTMLGGVLGLLIVATIFYEASPAAYPLSRILPYEHLVLGGFAFGIVFMATDPVSSPMTETGRFFYGLLIGGITVLIRVLNPGYPEGVMFAILLGNAVAPLIDKLYLLYFNWRRKARYAKILSKSIAGGRHE